MMLARRSFISSIIAAAAAPVIVRAGSIMPVKVMPAALAATDDHAVHLALHTEVVGEILPQWYRDYMAKIMDVGFRITREQIRANLEHSIFA